MFTTRPEIRGSFGAAASTHWLASAVAMGVLERGGNAFDAVCAGGFTLQVVEPHLNGPGGEVPIIAHPAERQQTQVICGQGTAPAAATIARFRELGLDLVPGSGLLAAVVPGAFDAWMLLLRDHGSWPVAEVLAPAIGYAENGYPLVASIAETITGVRRLFEDEWPSSAAVYLPGGDVPEPGRPFRNPGLAATYRRIVAQAEAAGGGREAQIEAARDAWYRGFVAEAIDRFCRENQVMDVSGRRHHGLLTADDMAGWRATLEAPVTYDYHGLTVCKAGPWCQGPVLLQQLALLKGFDLASMDPLGAEFVHTVVECAKLAFADREAFYGDPDFVEVPLETLLSDAYNDQRRRLIEATASTELRPGRVDGHGGPVDTGTGRRVADAARMQAQGVGEPTTAPPGPGAGDTCHIDVVDRHGNMVAATPSGGWLQSSPVIPDLGFCLGSRAQMFWLEEGRPASLAPGKRPRTTLTPSMALIDGRPAMAFGTPGGDKQDQWQLPFLLRHLHHAMDLQQAIDAPAFHTDHFPSSFWPRESRPGSLTLEGRFPPETVAELARRGHAVEVCDDWSEGRLAVVARDRDGLIKAAANARGMQGYAVGR